jgi:hypothetical protein
MTKIMLTLGTDSGVACGIAAADTQLPLDSQLAQDLMDTDGNVTLTLLLNQETTCGMSSPGPPTVHPPLQQQALGCVS